MSTYYLREVSEENFATIHSLFPMTTVDIENSRWVSHEEIDQYAFVWFYMYPGAVSLVYVPSSYPTYFNGNEVNVWRDDNNIIRLSTEQQGIKIVTGNGNVIIADEHICEARFAIPTKEELMMYKSQIACPVKYRKPVHRFVDRALGYI